MSNVKQRMTLNNLAEPQQMRELNRQLSWIWDQLLGGLSMKSMNSGTRAVIEGKVNASVFEQTADEIRMAVGEKLDADAPSVGVETGSGIVINENGVYAEGRVIDLRTSDGEEYVNISEAGVSASSITAPDVTPRYNGPAVLYVNPAYPSEWIGSGINQPGDAFRSLRDALASLSYKIVPYGVTINMAPGMTEYGNAELVGCICGHSVTINGGPTAPTLLAGTLSVRHCLGYVKAIRLTITPAEGHGVAVYGKGAFVHLTDCSVTGGDAGVWISDGAGAFIEYCEFYDANYAIYANMIASCIAVNNKGNCRIGAVYGSDVSVHGTAPSSSASAFVRDELQGGKVRMQGDAYVVVNQGASAGVPAVPAVSTMTALSISTASYKGSGGKYRDEVAQGWYEDIGRIRGCMWFDNANIRSALSGKVILSVSLRLSMEKGVGRGVGVTVELSGTSSNSGASGAAVTRNYGVIGTASPGEVMEITIPKEAIVDLISGTVNGLMLYSGDTGAYKERSYSKNYAVFGGQAADDNEKPMLTITYQG